MKNFYNWLCEMRLVWTCITFVFLAIICATAVAGVSEPKVRIAGLMLQLLGMSTVAYGIRQTRKIFGNPSYRSILVSWLRRFPLIPRRTIFGSINATLPPLTVKASGYAWKQTEPSASLEERVSALEFNLNEANNRVSLMHTELHQDIRKNNADLQYEQTLRAGGDQEIRKKLEETSVGGIHITLMGLVWLIVGVTMSTASNELINLIK